MATNYFPEICGSYVNCAWGNEEKGEVNQSKFIPVTKETT